MQLFLEKCLLCMCLIGSNYLAAQEGGSGFKKSGFYLAMSGKNENAVDRQLELLKTAAGSDKNAYEGALLMKKAGLERGAKKKLNLFKEGHKKLEESIKLDSSNVEFRLLRLMIQEHAPGMLGYKNELQKDGLFIQNNFKKLPSIAKEAAIDYSKGSKILKLEDL